MQQDKEFLGTAPVGHLLFKPALPTVVAQLVNMLYNVFDRIYIGQPHYGCLPCRADRRRDRRDLYHRSVHLPIQKGHEKDRATDGYLI